MLENRPDDHLFDERLAEFTDQVLKQEGSQIPSAVAEEEGLQHLQETVIQLKQAGLADRPDVPFSTRLFAVLQKEWKRFGPKPGQENRPLPADPSASRLKDGGIFKRIFATWGRQIVFGLTALMLLVILFLPKNATLAGASGTSPEWLPVEWIIGVLSIGLLIWLLLKKQD